MMKLEGFAFNKLTEEIITEDKDAIKDVLEICRAYRSMEQNELINDMMSDFNKE